MPALEQGDAAARGDLNAAMALLEVPSPFNALPTIDHDAFSALLDDVQCDGFSYAATRFAAPWAQHQSGFPDVTGYFVESGEAQIRLGDAAPVEIFAGDYAIIAPKLPHLVQNLVASDGAICLIGRANYGLDLDRSRALFRSLPPIMVLRSKNGHLEWLRALAHLTMNLSSRAQISNKAVLRRLTEAALIMSILLHREDQEALCRPALAPEAKRIAPGLYAMHLRPQLAWTLESLAREAGLSRSLFAAEFVKVLGESPGRYLTRLRLARAKELLGRSHLSLSAIAARVGYGDEVALGRAFRRQFGISLGKFRAVASGKPPSRWNVPR